MTTKDHDTGEGPLGRMTASVKVRCKTGEDRPRPSTVAARWRRLSGAVVQSVESIVTESGALLRS